MRFCPKCSLKIKANIEKCPICKVELLSCAEDEDLAAHSAAQEESPRTEGAGGPSPSSPEAPAEDKPDTAPGTLPPGEDLTVLSRKLKSLEDHLIHLEKTMEINSSKDDIIRSSIVDLESKINKQEKRLAALESFPLEHLNKLQSDMERLSSQATSPRQVSEGTEHQSPPPVAPAAPPAPATPALSTRDFSSQFRDSTSDAISFADDSEDDFDRSFEATLDEGSLPQRGKKKLPVILPLIALLLIGLWLAFYYAKPRREEMKEKVVAEKIVLPPPQETGSAQPTTKTPAPPRGEEPVTEEAAPATPPPPAEQQPPVTSSPKPPADAKAPPKTGGFTVNVGSFKEETLARTLTTQLKEKGYPVLMEPSKDKRFYRVKIGAFSTPEEARKYASVLEKKEKLPTFVTKITQP